jgi:hypothetical protein
MNDLRDLLKRLELELDSIKKAYRALQEKHVKQTEVLRIK